MTISCGNFGGRTEIGEVASGGSSGGGGGGSGDSYGDYCLPSTSYAVTIATNKNNHNYIPWGNIFIIEFVCACSCGGFLSRIDFVFMI